MPVTRTATVRRVPSPAMSTSMVSPSSTWMALPRQMKQRAFDFSPSTQRPLLTASAGGAATASKATAARAATRVRMAIEGS
jgi:hypothetical protein